ncbi:hypothetical protein DJ568_04600 [Mucilaginibacter hurinus]|uniref:Uncharacterized protein n=1 Tax=Mucilaginibacter hurinus TaxID=2201324 RepID=A0A367GRE4_9SPHI|nr:hypothetical protein [Mucilaginibacter hurinus]RCH56032.1 hypothetical protein DJ568_04600 [Mucilaginibacter hurinus]
MIFAPFFTISIIVLANVVFNYKNNKVQLHQRELLIERLKNKIVYDLPGIKCDFILIGQGRHDYRFNQCDIYVTDDALIVLGYGFLLAKLHCRPLIFTKNVNHYSYEFPGANVIMPDKFNPYSVDSEVYIEFGQAGFTSTNVTYNLKGIPEEGRKKMEILIP